MRETHLSKPSRNPPQLFGIEAPPWSHGPLLAKILGDLLSELIKTKKAHKTGARVRLRPGQHRKREREQGPKIEGDFLVLICIQKPGTASREASPGVNAEREKTAALTEFISGGIRLSADFITAARNGPGDGRINGGKSRSLFEPSNRPPTPHACGGGCDAPCKHRRDNRRRADAEVRSQLRVITLIHRTRDTPDTALVSHWTAGRRTWPRPRGSRLGRAGGGEWTAKGRGSG
ncbi:hypothetical protein SKAU_G00177220 [Synaphobranchus kaupii]|uniref:Uncharacterized protein n=1 Tax=Synaphobranchus kaupii TaxID=118154 RepID=A0A9Q1FM32_SYNKA|nr:hypothetical protein SKAU_G00177220 [Synaphobranchus kaupii]